MYIHSNRLLKNCIPHQYFPMPGALKTYFLGAGFNELQVSQIIAPFRLKLFKKGAFFAESSKTSKQLGFIQSGYFQYYINVDGEEKTTYSLGPNNLIASLVSLLRKVPARENIRAVSDSSVWIISQEAFTALRNTIPAFNDFYIGMLEWQICCIEESRLDGIILSARERYEKMLHKEPQMVQHIPLQYLSSILGITPRHLSRIRSSIR
jgi:CRP-like cAMP-binding protein